MFEIKKYRPCVGIMLFNKEGKVFTGKRIDTPNENIWQMPQGGIDDNEEPETAALRELLEEVGTNNVEIVSREDEWLYYEIPLELIHSNWHNKYIGQKQKWFLMLFKGEDSGINIDTDHPEFTAWRWQCCDELVNDVVFFKKKIYTEVINAFKPKILERVGNFNIIR